MSDFNQVKYTIDSDTVSAFKDRCYRQNVSMTSDIRQFMKTNKPSTEVKNQNTYQAYAKRIGIINY